MLFCNLQASKLYGVYLCSKIILCLQIFSHLYSACNLEPWAKLRRTHQTCRPVGRLPTLKPALIFEDVNVNIAILCMKQNEYAWNLYIIGMSTKKILVTL